VWAAGVGAVDLLGEQAAATPTVGDLVVLGALRSLTISVNLSTGLAHPSDWDHALYIFRALRAGGHRIDGDEIERWALANGWSYRHAADVGQLARDIAAGKTKRTKSRGAPRLPTSATIDHWRELGQEADWSPL
jgi:hypothetical protein